MSDHREKLGMRVRQVWIAWAEHQPNPKPSWLVPWDGLSEPDKEVDRCIGAALWNEGFADGIDLHPETTILRARCEAAVWMEAAEKCKGLAAYDGMDCYEALCGKAEAILKGLEKEQ